MLCLTGRNQESPPVGRALFCIRKSFARKGSRNPGVVNQMLGFLDILFGCYHRNYSFPITKKRGQRVSPAAALTGTYVVCLDCGKEFPYDWDEMRVLSAKATRQFEGLPAGTTQFASK